MGKRTFLVCVVMLSGAILAQQPVPMGKTDDSAKNYRSVDGTTLSKNSSDDDLTRALNENYANNPEFSNIRVAVKHRKVTLAGTVLTKDAKKRAEVAASHMAGVRDVRDHLKIGEPADTQPTGIMTSSAH